MINYEQEILNQFKRFAKAAVLAFIDGTENVKSINVIYILYLIYYFVLPKSFIKLLHFCIFSLV